jgi:(S)-citramalyl-CoA lyase
MTASAPSSGPAPQRRSVLFVSGMALQELQGALGSGADAVCIDLEDAVPPPRKAQAREALFALLAGVDAQAGARLMVRINSLRTVDGLADMQAFLTRPHTVAALVLPKVETDDEMRWAAALAEDAGSALQFLCIIETAQGLENCQAIARAPRLAAIFFGGFDLSSALGAEMAWEPLLYARSRVVHAASGAGGLQVLDSPFPAIADLEGLRASAAQARALGMTGKTAKHASQVEAINAAFTPDAAQLEHARRVVEAFLKDPGRPLVVDGKLVELPTIKRLQRMVAMAPGSAAG